MIFVTVFFGVIAGYGAIITAHFAFSYVSGFFARSSVDDNKIVLDENKINEDGNVKKSEPSTRRALGFMTQSGTYHLMDAEMSVPKLYAKSFSVVDMETGETIAQKDSFVEYPIASLTKLMTALVAIKQIDQTSATTVSARAISTYGTQAGLRSGERLSVTALLYALLLPSSNDSAEALAEIVGREKFLEYMNAEADFLGMKNTRFIDTSGLSEKNVSSADDLGRLAQHLYKNYPELIDITRTRSYRSGAHTWYNASVFSSDSRYVGGKNGYTDEARYTLVAIFRLPLGKNSEMRDVAIILLGGEKNEKDTRALILYLLRNVEFY